MRRALAVCVASAAALAGCGGDSGMKYGAAFQAPSGVEEGDELVAGDEEVGEVQKVENRKRGTLEFEQVEFTVEEGGPTLYRDASLVARGDRVILRPGTPGRPPLVEGNILPMAQTRSERR